MAKVPEIDKRLPDTWQAMQRDFSAWKQAQPVAPRALDDFREEEGSRGGDCSA